MAAVARSIGRYALFDEIASGGMATVCLGRLVGPAGFSRTVAVKCLHKEYARDPEFVAMLLDEARLAARIQHPNVVSTLDVVVTGGELFLVMDYVHGESLARVLRVLQGRHEGVPVPVAAAIAAGALHGLHAAHEAKGEDGVPLALVHRDVSPQNILLGADGTVRVTDFGVAKAAGRIQSSSTGQLKGKFGYMSPEQVLGRTVDRRTDIFAASIVLWEMLSGRRLFQGVTRDEVLARVVATSVPSLSKTVPGLPARLEEVLLCALDPEPEQRFATAREFAQAIERTIAVATPPQISDWLEHSFGEVLAERTKAVSSVEARWGGQPNAAEVIEKLVSSEVASTARSDYAWGEPGRPLSPPSGDRAEPVSQMATVSQSRSEPRRGLRLAGLASIIVVGLLAALTLVRASLAPGRPSAAPSSSAAVPEPSQAPAPPAPSEVPSPPAPSDSAAPHSPVPPLPPFPSASGAGGKTPPHPRPRPSDCTPPYTVDAQGRKHFKMQCL
jgi:serine/threonine-protein kinase